MEGKCAKSSIQNKIKNKTKKTKRREEKLRKINTSKDLNRINTTTHNLNGLLIQQYLLLFKLKTRLPFFLFFFLSLSVSQCVGGGPTVLVHFVMKLQTCQNHVYFQLM